MTSRMALECDYCTKELTCWGMAEFFDEGWVELSIGGDEFDTETLDFCSIECCYLHLEEQLGNGGDNDTEITS